ncbi:hypothetical protein [Ponticaulis sp.]|uniref:hypothetical protein n=1 Tax=Ponticaulis sp. TaxID=2020902 RepID=UPI000C59B212|nr:hypothetical protein [Ponticaulis sp.]MAF59080.1 hypothetical protein [Ponticaulis sp.]MBN03060.1 hypothetical protein [Ponticaulis sp.]|tara:strand:- start:599 stop:1228 length:630 start_codon:yes stop_codon:yes gene_type:complete
MIMKSTTLMAALTLGFAGMASAQNSSIDAVVTLEESTPALALSGESSLSFGAVNIPNGTETDHVCGYLITVSEATPQTSLLEYSEQGSAIDGSAPTPSGCNWGSSGTPDASYGAFAISCNPSSVINFTATWTSGGTTGVELRQGSGMSLRAFLSGTYTALANGGNGAMTATCPNSGSFDVAVGGQVRVGTNATAATDVNFGTVTLDATY